MCAMPETRPEARFVMQGLSEVRTAGRNSRQSARGDCCDHGWPAERGADLRGRADQLKRGSYSICSRSTDPRTGSCFCRLCGSRQVPFRIGTAPTYWCADCVSPRQTQTRCADQNSRDRTRHRWVGCWYTGAEHRQDISINPFGARRSAAQRHSDRKE